MDEGIPVAEADETYLTIEEVAERYRTHPGTVRYWRHVGYGPPGFRIGRRILYPRSGLERWEAEQQTAATT